MSLPGTDGELGAGPVAGPAADGALGGEAEQDLRAMVAHSLGVQTTESVAQVYRRFRQEGVAYLAVLEGDRAVGICSRAAVGILLGSQYGFALFSKHAIGRHCLTSHLEVRVSEPLRQILDKALSREGEAFYHDVVLADEEGRFLGLIGTERLAQTQAAMLARQFESLERQQRELHDANRRLFRTVNQLRQTRDRYETVFENMVIGVALLGAGTEVESANGVLLEMLGVPAGESVRGPLSELVEPEDRAAFARAIRRHADNPRDPEPREAEFRFALPDGRQRLFLVQTRWVAATGQVCACFKDITEQRVLERRLARREKQELLETLAGGVAHEINNKLLPIIGFAEMLRDGRGELQASEVWSEHCSKIIASAAEAARIVRNLLHLSKPASGQRSVRDLREGVKDAMAMVQFKLRQNRIESQVRLPPEPVPVLMDSDQIKQILINLLLNAADAMEGGPERRLAVELSRTGRAAELRVSDSGHGVPPDIAARIFDPFFSTKAPDRGTGLGLAVCASLAQQHGGEVALERTGPAGSVFRLVLPVSGELAAAAEPAAPDEDGGATEGATGGARVLVADDEEFVLHLLQEILRIGCGHTVNVVSDGSEAVRALEKGRYDLVVSDMRMPGLNGLELFDWIGAHIRDDPPAFLMISGDEGSPKLAAKIREKGIPFLRKPFSTEMFVRECERLLADRCAAAATAAAGGGPGEDDGVALGRGRAPGGAGVLEARV